jgi:acyl transferase domain-containing protein
MQTDKVLQDSLEIMKQSLEQLQVYREKEYRQREPLAIVGMAGRFPGNGKNLNAFWKMLLNGEDAVTEVPPERWDVDEFYDPNPEAIGKIYTRCGAFLKDIEQFDNSFFGIAPTEAWSMDPQQRLLLELSWRAFENAGYLPRVEPDTGVFVGVCTAEYIMKLTKPPIDTIDKKAFPYFSTGNVFNALSGRLSYIFGFQGPCVAMDTACSSSLVALHLACNAIRNGDCKQALVGGVNLQLIPESTMAISSGRMLSADGHCKTFDDSANGYVRGEGCAVVIIKPLSEAIKNNDRIHAVIRGSAVNQDGGGSGFTVPSSKAQEKLMRKALSNAGLNATEVDYLEAHGTGTSLGDPIELSAVQAVYGSAKRQQPLWVGSVKTNIGHLEAAAGITGVVKTVLSLKHKTMPAHLHLKKPNPRIPWNRYNMKIPVKNQPWPAVGRPERAAVSAFGFSGTNAHVILEAAPAPSEAAASHAAGPHIFTLSARSREALAQYAESYIALLEQSPAYPLSVLCKAAQRLNPLMRYRAAFIVSDAEELASQLRQFVQQEALEMPEPANGREQYSVVFSFSGQGEAALPLYRELYEQQPVFSQCVDHYADFLKKNKGIDLLKVSGISEDMKKDPASQPAWAREASFFVLEYATVMLLKAWSIFPDAVIGHQRGEYTAACAAGVMEVEDALRLIMAKEEGGTDDLETFRNVLSYVALKAPVIPFISGSKGGEAKKDLAAQDHWTAHASGISRIDEAMGAFQQMTGDKICIEIGNNLIPILKHIRETVSSRETLLHTLNTLYKTGFELDWAAFYAQTPNQVIEELPGYPFQLKRFWPDDPNPDEHNTWVVKKVRERKFNKQQLLEYLYGADSWTEQEKKTIAHIADLLSKKETARKTPVTNIPADVSE